MNSMRVLIPKRTNNLVRIPGARPAANPVLWLANTSVVLNNSSQVLGWNDQSGNGFNVRALTEANRPQLLRDSFQYIRFDGVDDFLTTDKGLNQSFPRHYFGIIRLIRNTHATAQTIFAHKPRTPAGDDRLDLGAYAFFQRPNTAGISVRATAGTGTANVNVNLLAGVWQRVHWWFTNSGTVLNARVGNSTTVTNTYVAVTADQSRSDLGFHLGASINTTNNTPLNFAQVDVAEMLMYGEMGTNRINEVYSYLDKKYGLA